jgi:hypothetical protein
MIANILKGAGRAVKDFGGKASTEIGKATSKIRQMTPDMPQGPDSIGPFQKLSGKHLENPQALYQLALPYQIKNKYTVPLALGGVAATGLVSGVGHFNQAKGGTIHAGTMGGLSGMTEGTIADASATVVSPLLKELNDGSSRSARANSANIRDSIQTSVGVKGAEGDLVFALHNMR